jgi:hypothetical protein
MNMDSKFQPKFEQRFEHLLRRFHIDELDSSHEWLTIQHYLTLARRDLVDALVNRLGTSEGTSAPSFIAGQIQAIDNLLQAPKYLHSLHEEVQSRAREDPKEEA